MCTRRHLEKKRVELSSNSSNISRSPGLDLTSVLEHTSRHLLRALALKFSQRVNGSRCQGRTSETLSSTGRFLICTFWRAATAPPSTVRSWRRFCETEVVVAATSSSHNLSQTLFEQIESPTQILFAHPGHRLEDVNAAHWQQTEQLPSSLFHDRIVRTGCIVSASKAFFLAWRNLPRTWCRHNESLLKHVRLVDIVQH